MAMVYRARDLLLERTVAIKILRRDFWSDTTFRQRFHQEAKAAANLSHPNIVTVHDFGLNEDQLFIVMEYVPGTDLKRLLKQRGRFGVYETIELMDQACAGIGYAHRAGLVHCDVKPQNMLVTPDGHLKVVDFGIARALASISPDERSEIVWGSPQYFSPEQAAGGPPSPASDVYSLGVVLFEMLTGQLPFSAPTSQELARLHRDTPPPSLRKLNPAIPASLEQIVLKVLSKEPSLRYRTADQLGRVLVTYNQQGQVDAAFPTPSKPRPIQGDATYPTPSRPRPIQGNAATPTPSRPRPVPAAELHPPSAPRASQSGTPWENPPAMLVESYPAGPELVVRPSKKTLGFDWLTWLLGLLALIAVGGLVPFWLWVYYVLNPPL